MKPYFIWINSLSLDVAFGAVALFHFVQSRLDISLSLFWSLGLFFAIWGVYTLDHWVDARVSNLQTHRHTLHRQNPVRLGLLIVFCFAACLFLAFGILGPLSWQFGILMSGLVLLHLLLTHFLSGVQPVLPLKEISVAITYSMGIIGVPAFLNGQWENSWILFSGIFGAAFGNLWLFSVKEGEGNPPSLGWRFSLALAAAFSLLGAMGSLFQGGGWFFTAILLFQWSLYWVLGKKDVVGSQWESFRFWVDASFLLFGLGVWLK